MNIAPELDEFGTCPFALIVGEPCILCGGTRAVASALRGDLSSAAAFNWPVLVMVAALICAATILVIHSGPRGLWQRVVALGRPPANPQRVHLSLAAFFALWWAWNIARW